MWGRRDVLYLNMSFKRSEKKVKVILVFEGKGALYTGRPREEN